MRVRLPLRLKIGLFAVALVALACAAVWWFAVWRPALAERARREAEYHQIAFILAANGVLPSNALLHPSIHPDLAFVVRARAGVASPSASVAHVARLARVDPQLAREYGADPEGGLRALLALHTGERAGLVVKRVRVKTEEGDNEIVLGFSTASLDEALRSRLRASLLVLALALAAAIAGAFLLAGRIARPVRELVLAMELTGRGTLVPVDLRSSDEVGLLAAAFNDMIQALRDRERLRSTLARYVSDDVAARILSERSDLDLEGELREVTVLFLDVRGFGALAEQLPPREVVALLNTYFEIIIEVIFKYHGTLNKFIGDAIMAIFGAPFAVDDAPMRAVRTAVEIQQQVAVLNQDRRERGQPTVALGIGINTGPAIAGNVGSERRMEYTVIGDEVNLAQSLEANAREGELLVAQATFERVRERIEFRARPPVPVKGKTIPVWTYEVIGLKG